MVLNRFKPKLNYSLTYINIVSTTSMIKTTHSPGYLRVVVLVAMIVDTCYKRHYANYSYKPSLERFDFISFPL